LAVFLHCPLEGKVAGTECKKGFTVIGFLVVIAIIAILAAILFPSGLTCRRF
jgi:prepilin-type N-terminal cleavage/methylation domain-containing protein